MAGNHYDATADSYSFGICLVAMIRGEKDVMVFYFQALRKTMKRKTRKGVGITILNNRMYSEGWRPLLPLEFERSYPKLCKLLKRCWAQKKEDRPSFDEIVKTGRGGGDAERRTYDYSLLRGGRRNFSRANGEGGTVRGGGGDERSVNKSMRKH